jgi:hypothetical protein
MALLADGGRRCRVLVFVLPSGLDSHELAYGDLGSVYYASRDPVGTGNFCLEPYKRAFQNVTTAQLTNLSSALMSDIGSWC